jgi:spore germination protein YaaH
LDSLENFFTELPGLTEKFDPTLASLEETPGYKFALDQGLKATNNSLVSKGLANSGAALKGAASYAEGLAGQTFQQAFQNNMAEKSQRFNMLFAPVQMGANAAAMQGGNAMTLGTNLGNTYQNQGNQLASIYMNDAAQKNQLMGTLLGGLMSFL